MNKTQEALKLALEALEYIEHNYMSLPAPAEKAITAIREALAERCVCGEPDTPGTHRTDGPCLAEQPAQQQEPVAWHGYDLDGMVEAFDRVIQAHYNSKQPFHSPVDSDAQMALRILRGFIPSMKRYTSPPASKPWVGLTDEEKSDLWCESTGRDCVNEDTHVFADAIEAKLRKKNA